MRNYSEYMNDFFFPPRYRNHYDQGIYLSTAACIFSVVLTAGTVGAFGTLLVPECALAAGGALNVFGACFIGSAIIFLPAYAAIGKLTDGLAKSINSNHTALILTWIALMVSAIGACILTSAAIGSAVLGIATYNVTACFLAGGLTVAIGGLTLMRLNETNKQAYVARVREEAEQPGVAPGVAINRPQHYRHNQYDIFDRIPNDEYIEGFILHFLILNDLEDFILHLLTVGLISGSLGAFGTLLVPECALAVGGALNVFGACFIGSAIIFIPASVAILNFISGLAKSINSSHAALVFTWGALLVSAIGAALLTSAAIGSAVLGIATYNVSACLLGASACLLTGAMVFSIADRFISWLDGFTENASAAASAEVDGEPGRRLNQP